MTIFRFVLAAVLITLALVVFGCSQGPNQESSSAAVAHDEVQSTRNPGQVNRQLQWWRDEAMVDALGLDENQVQAVTDMMAVNIGDGKIQRQRERQLSLKYLRALALDPYDAELVESISERLIEILSSEHRRRIESIHQLRDILTAEQWNRLWEMRPGVLQSGRFKVARGPSIEVQSDPEAVSTPTP